MRTICDECERPSRACICHGLPKRKLSGDIRILIVQTAAEASRTIGTASLIPRVYANAQIVSKRQVSDSFSIDGAVLLFPGPHSTPLSAVQQGERPRTVVLLDGTWKSARRFLSIPSIRALPRVHLDVVRAPLFRVRRPPSSVVGAVSTAEAAAEALEVLDGEGGAAAARALRHAVHTLSEVQLAFIRESKARVPHRTEKRGYVEGLYEAQG